MQTADIAWTCREFPRFLDYLRTHLAAFPDPAVSLRCAYLIAGLRIPALGAHLNSSNWRGPLPDVAAMARGVDSFISASIDRLASVNRSRAVPLSDSHSQVSSSPAPVEMVTVCSYCGCLLEIRFGAVRPSAVTISHGACPECKCVELFPVLSRHSVSLPAGGVPGVSASH